jgi:hypothetical protein
MLPIVRGITPEKLVKATNKVWIDPFNGNSGNEPWRFKLNDMSRIVCVSI